MSGSFSGPANTWFVLTMTTQPQTNCFCVLTLPRMALWSSWCCCGHVNIPTQLNAFPGHTSRLQQGHARGNDFMACWCSEQKVADVPQQVRHKEISASVNLVSLLKAVTSANPAQTLCQKYGTEVTIDLVQRQAPVPTFIACPAPWRQPVTWRVGKVPYFRPRLPRKHPRCNALSLASMWQIGGIGPGFS